MQMFFRNPLTGFYSRIIMLKINNKQFVNFTINVSKSKIMTFEKNNNYKATKLAQ